VVVGPASLYALVLLDCEHTDLQTPVRLGIMSYGGKDGRYFKKGVGGGLGATGLVTGG